MEILECSICGERYKRIHKTYENQYMWTPFNCCSEFCFSVLAEQEEEKQQKKKGYYQKKNKQKIKKLCKHCGKEFSSIEWHKQKYCSKICAKAVQKAQLEKQKEITYFDIFKRDSFKCRYCGKSPKDGIKLVVDHIYPVSRGGKADSFNLITACNECNLHKSNKLFPLQLVLDLWKENQFEFSYEEAKEYFEQCTKRREKNLRRKKKDGL